VNVRPVPENLRSERKKPKENVVKVQNDFARSAVKLALALAFASFFLGFLWVALSGAQEPNRRTFNSPDEAGSAFFAAAQGENNEALLAILGPEGRK
jgi:hypothetical protein